MMKLNDGRSELWQWDTGRTLTVDADCSQVHFSNKIFGRSIDVDVVDGVASIPDILLQTDKELTAWAFVGTPENGYTKISKVFKVNKRNKPADYVFTPPDQTTLGELVERLEKIEETQDPDAIKNAVDDYLDNNPIQIKETDPTVPEWAKQPEKPNYTAEEVGALPADTVIPDIPAIPSKLPNPHPLTFTGAVEATYDGSEPVEVAIPQGGGGGEKWELIAQCTVDTPVSDIEISKDLNGNAFRLKQAFILARCKWEYYDGTSKTGDCRLALFVNHAQLMHTSNKLSSCDEYLLTKIMLFACGNEITGYASCNRSLGSNSQNMNAVYNAPVDNGKFGTINHIKITGPYQFVSGVGNGYVASAGSTVEIYGVRA